MIPAPFAEHEEAVRPEWVDYNGHMNLAYYVVIFDHATDALFEAISIGEAFRQASGFTTFVVEMHTLYERELMEGERAGVRTQIVAADAKRLHIAHEMIQSATGRRAAAQELMLLHVDLATRRTAPLRPDALARIEKAAAAHAALPRPGWVGRRITMPG